MAGCFSGVEQLPPKRFPHATDSSPNYTSMNANSAGRRPVLQRPTCTHIYMDRVYSENYTCSLCNRVPSTGFIYVCQQDAYTQPVLNSWPTSQLNEPARRRKLQKRDPNASSNPGEPPSNRRSLTTKALFEALGFNKSVIKGLEEGDYTEEQIEKLKAQKIQARKVLTAALDQRHEMLKSKNGPEPTILAEKLSTLRSTQEIPLLQRQPAFTEREEDKKSKYLGNLQWMSITRDSPKEKSLQPPNASPNDAEPDERKSIISMNFQKLPTSWDTKAKARKRQKEAREKAKTINRPVQACDFRVCQTCRPYSRDRSFTSFEAVFNEEITLPSTWAPEFMPVIPIHTAAKMGLRKPLDPVRLSPSGSEIELEQAESDLSFTDSSGSTAELLADDEELMSSDVACEIDEYGYLRLQELNQISAGSMPGAWPRSRPLTPLPSQPLQAHRLTPVPELPEDGFATEPTTPNFNLIEKRPNLARESKDAFESEPDTSGWRRSLANDLQDLIQREEIAATILGDVDSETGAAIHHPINHLYRENEGHVLVFDYDVWRRLNNTLLELARLTPLPGGDGEDDLDIERDTNRVYINGTSTKSGSPLKGRTVPSMKKDRAKKILRKTKSDIPKANSMNNFDMLRSGLLNSSVEDGEHVVEGFALTEEAAENKAPDVITSI